MEKLLASGVILVSTDKVTVEAFSRVCNEMGTELVHVENREGLDALDAKSCPSIILVDLALPGLAGLSLLSSLSGDPVHSWRDRLGILPDEPSPDLALLGIRLGVRDFLTRPLADQEILSTLKFAGKLFLFRQGIQIPAEGQRGILTALLHEKGALKNTTIEELVYSQWRSVVLGRSLFENAIDLILVCDAEGRIQECNETTEIATEYSRGELIGQHIDSCGLFKGESIIELLKNDIPVFQLQQTLTTKSGEEILVETNAVAIRGKKREFLGCNAIMRDITYRLKAEAEIRNLNKELKTYSGELEKKVEQLDRASSELKAAQQRLVESEKLALLGKFSTKLAHEILNPLSSLKIWVQSLQDEWPADDRNTLSLMEYQVDRIERVVRGLREYSRPSMVPQVRLKINEHLKKLSGLFLIPFPEVEVELDLEQDLDEVEIDLTRLESVFVNLLSNALEATEGAGEVRVCSRRASDNNWLLVVEDDGPGIPDEFLERVFEPFFSTKEETGLGLGLPLVRENVLAMGGTLGVNNRDTGGLRVVVTLPFTNGD